MSIWKSLVFVVVFFADRYLLKKLCSKYASNRLQTTRMLEREGLLPNHIAHLLRCFCWIPNLMCTGLWYWSCGLSAYCSLLAGDCRRGRDECISCTEGGCGDHLWVTVSPTATLLADAHHYFSWKEFHYPLPTASQLFVQISSEWRKITKWRLKRISFDGVLWNSRWLCPLRENRTKGSWLRSALMSNCILLLKVYVV